MIKSEHPQDITISEDKDYVQCSCRFKNRLISVTYIKSQKAFQTQIKSYFAKDGLMGAIEIKRRVHNLQYNLTIEALTCLTAIQTELLEYLHNDTDYLK